VGFKPVNFKFAFIYAWRESPPQTLNPDAMRPEHWYLTPGD